MMESPNNMGVDKKMSSLGLNEKTETPTLVAAATWADSCLVFDEDVSVGDDSLNLLMDTLIEKKPNFFNTSDENSYTTSLDSKHQTISSAAQTSSSTELSMRDDLDMDEEDGNHYEFVHEKTNDPTRIRYRGEEYTIFEGHTPEEIDKDPNPEEAATAFLGDIESVENIFKVWDLRVSDEDDEENELTSNLREALQESYLTRTAEKVDADPSVSLNADQLDDLVNELTGLSLSPEQQ